MMYKTSELSGAMLDAAVAKAEGVEVAQSLGGYLAFAWSVKAHPYSAKGYSPSTDFDQGGPIIERERIILHPGAINGTWESGVMSIYSHEGPESSHWTEGPTPLISAMRAYVASKFGEEVEL